MPSSSALTFRRAIGTIDNTGTGAGTQWLHVLYELYHYFMTTSNAVDTGRWTIRGSNLTDAQWGTLANVTDNSWFTVRSNKGRYNGANSISFKFQASNVAALDELPSTTYTLICSLCSDGNWGIKGGANGGWTTGNCVFSGNCALSNSNQSGNPAGSSIIVGDRETIIIALAGTGSTAFDGGGYVGRFIPESDQVYYPECIIGASDGVGAPGGFDRSAGGVFGTTPKSSSVLNENMPVGIKAATTIACYTSGWMNTTFEPSQFSGLYHYRPIEICTPNSYIGTLRHTWSCSNMAVKTRADADQKLVLFEGSMATEVCIAHDGLVIP